MADDSFELNEINQLIASIRPYDQTDPAYSHDPLLRWLALSQGSGASLANPHLDHPRLSLFSATHPFASEQNLSNDFDYGKFIQGCLSGTGRLNRLAQNANTDLRLYEMDPQDQAADDSFTAQELVRCMAYGMMAVEPGLDLLGLCAFGHGSRQVALALIALHSDTKPSADLTIARLMKQAQDAKGLKALIQIGGYELSALCGSVMAARLANCPVILEGVGGLAVYLMLHHENPALVEHCRLCGVPEEFTGFAEPAKLASPVTMLTGATEPGLILASLIPTLRTHVILSEGQPQIAAAASNQQRAEQGKR